MTSAQPAIRQRARELLAAEYDRLGDPEIARALRDNLGGFFEPSLRALEAALTSCQTRTSSETCSGRRATSSGSLTANLYEPIAPKGARHV